ncbi:ATP-binding protein [Streptomyces sp. NPDC056069]|uniref:ATP-binding protein n=1 Tax=Streptomyces sp. NPDC056069 TaxID=3345702 RepID=UPI0035E0C99A
MIIVHQASESGQPGVAADSLTGSGSRLSRIPESSTANEDTPCDSMHQILEHCPDTVAAARNTARQLLKGWQVSRDCVDRVALVVSELVTNAIEHALPPVMLHIHRDRGDRVWVGVSDGGPAPNSGAWIASCATDEHGRGLTIVDALAEAHGTHAYSAGATTRWARIITD